MAKALAPVVFESYTAMLEILLKVRRNELAETTQHNYKTFGGRFVTWLDEQDEDPKNIYSKRQAALARAFLNGPIGDLSWRSRKVYGAIIHMLFWFLAGGRDGEGLEQYQVIPEPPKWKVSTIVKDEHDVALCPKDDEWERLVEYLRDEADPHDEYSLRELAEVLVAGTGGVRRTELTNLVWRDLTFARDGSQVDIFIRKGKGKRDRKTKANADAVDALLALRECLAKWGMGKDDAWVFGVYGPVKDEKTGRHTGEVRYQRQDPDTISAMFLRLSKRLGFHVTCHSLRHYASHVWTDKESLTPVDAKNLLGHSSLITTARYIDIEASSTLAKLDAINKAQAQGRKVVPLQPRRKKMPQPVATLAA